MIIQKFYLKYLCVDTRVIVELVAGVEWIFVKVEEDLILYVRW